MLDVNVVAMVRVTRPSCPELLGQRPRSRIVNVSSIAGKKGTFGQAAYNASKHAQIGLTRCLALETGTTGLRVNAVCPGFTKTDLIDLDELGRAHGKPGADVWSTVEQAATIKRTVTLDEIAAGGRLPRQPGRRRRQRAVAGGRRRHRDELTRPMPRSAANGGDVEPVVRGQRPGHRPGRGDPPPAVDRAAGVLAGRAGGRRRPPPLDRAPPGQGAREPRGSSRRSRRRPASASGRACCRSPAPTGSGWWPRSTRSCSPCPTGCSETVDLAVLSGDHVVFIDQVARPQRLQTVSAVGVSFPLHSTANGKALLATLDEAEIRKLLPARLRRLTCHTITSLDVLLAELEEVRDTGLAWDREENDIGICAVGSTVADRCRHRRPRSASRCRPAGSRAARTSSPRRCAPPPAHGAQAGGLSGPAAGRDVARRGLPGSEGVSRDRARRDVACLLRRTTCGPASE